jgi:acetyl esterase/lipase
MSTQGFFALFIPLMVVALFMTTTDLHAQEKRPVDAQVIDIWPGMPPLHQELAEPESWGRWGLININTPTLTIYPATPDKADGTAVLILPGGGYNTVCINHEGHQAALWFAERGIAAFVLKYRCKPYKHPVELLDAQRAIRLIRKNAAQYKIDPQRVGVMGFSAGGHLAAMLSTIGQMTFNPPVDDIDQQPAKPNFTVLGYPVITLSEDFAYRGCVVNLLGKKPDHDMAILLSPEKQVTENTPPAFLIHGTKDTGVIVKNSEMYRDALLAKHIPAKLIMVEDAGHGFGLRDAWAQQCLAWLKEVLPAKQ